jgi:hypothetical protein
VPGTTAPSHPGLVWAVRGALLLCGLLLPLLLLELTLRLAGPILPGEYQTAAFTSRSSAIGRQNQPNTAGWKHTDEFTTWVQVGSKGLRGPETSYTKPPGVYRVLVLGDSFTFALQVAEEETFVVQLAERLNASGGGPRVETINAGTDGWSTANELAWFQQEGYRYEPDLVLLMYYVGNDPGENADLVGTLEQVDHPRFGARDDGPLGSLRTALRGRLLMFNVFEQAILARTTPPALAPTVKAPKEQRHADLERKARGWVISQALLARLRDAVAARGSKLAVVGIPLAGQVREADREPSPLVEIGRTLQVPEIELFDTFAAQPSRAREQLYFAQNGHWTPSGHVLVAQTLATELRGRGLVP